jgi:hypothetical protein
LIKAGVDVRGHLRLMARWLAVGLAASPRRGEIDREASPERLRTRHVQGASDAHTFDRRCHTRQHCCPAQAVPNGITICDYRPWEKPVVSAKSE